MQRARVVLAGFITCALAAVVGVGCILANPTDPRAGDKNFCDPTPVSGLAVVEYPDGGGDAGFLNIAGTCDQCLQDHCCAQVGACHDKQGCEDDAKKDFQTMLGASAKGFVQRAASTEGESDEAAALSSCLASSCTVECGVGPSQCVPNLAAPLIVGSDCDTCMSTRCCFDLNACYSNRPCKNAFNCIASCQDIASDFFTRKDAVDEIVNVQKTLCNGGSTSFGEGGMIRTPSDCVNQCILDFFINGKGEVDGGDIALAPACLSIDLFACLGENCSDDCNHGDRMLEAGSGAGADATADATPESSTSDASGDANDGAPE